MYPTNFKKVLFSCVCYAKKQNNCLGKSTNALWLLTLMVKAKSFKQGHLPSSNSS